MSILMLKTRMLDEERYSESVSSENDKECM